MRRAADRSRGPFVSHPAPAAVGAWRWVPMAAALGRFGAGAGAWAQVLGLHPDDPTPSHPTPVLQARLPPTCSTVPLHLGKCVAWHLSFCLVSGGSDQPMCGRSHLMSCNVRCADLFQTYGMLHQCWGFV
ncbi:hypothetical protein PLESTM_000034900 [Pleodorina starrii]|nr:hypothetical protein PLESTM_000034900 [Pleodorina starrii]